MATKPPTTTLGRLRASLERSLKNINKARIKLRAEYGVRDTVLADRAKLIELQLKNLNKKR